MVPFSKENKILIKSLCECKGNIAVTLLVVYNKVSW